MFYSSPRTAWATLRSLPAVLRIALALLVTVAAFGQWWQRSPTSVVTRTILAIVEHSCPAAAVRVAQPIVADGAAAIDRWAYRAIAKHIRRDGRDRCRS